MKSLERNERITLRQVTRIYHWFRSIQLHFIIPKLILSIHVIYEKCVIFIFQIWIFDEMRGSHNVSKICRIFSAQSKSACGGLVRQVRHFVQPRGHPSLFHTVKSFLIWYNMFCVRAISYRLIWMEFINMFSVYAQFGKHSRFNWWIIVVLT